MSDSNASLVPSSLLKSLTSRLKILHDEIKKPYFMELKKFLWKEGVQGPNDEVKGPNKVYPIRTYKQSTRFF